MFAETRQCQSHLAVVVGLASRINVHAYILWMHACIIYMAAANINTFSYGISNAVH